jgi:Tol biopolymer transport system component
LAFFDEQATTTSLQILDTQDDLVHILPYPIEVYAPLIWSPDGRFLSLLLKVSDDEPYAIAIWDVMSDEMVTSLDSSEFYKFFWSPDAAYVTFIPNDADQEFAVFNIAAKELRLYEGSWGEAWSPNGRYLIHYRKGENDGSQTFVLDTIEDEVFQLGDVQSDTVFHAWSPDSRYVVYETRSAQFSYLPEDRRWETPMKFLQVYDLTTQKTFTLDLTGNFYHPGRWSAQGQILTYTSGMDFVGEVNRLMVVDMVAGKIHEFGADPGELIYDRPPRWSPDGRYFDLWTQQGISIYDHQTELLRPVTESLVSPSSFGWSASGRYLGVYSIAEDNSDIYVVDTEEDLRLRNLTNTPKEREFVIGWRGTGRNTSLIHCGIG